MMKKADETKFTLVRYTEDGILYVCKSKCVKDGDKGMTLAKYVNGKWFKATVIKEGEEEVLTFIKRQLEYCAVALTKPATEEFTGAVDNAPESFTGGSADIAPESFSGGSADNAPESFTGRPVDNAPESLSGGSADNAPESFTGRPVDNAPESFTGRPVDNAPESFSGGSADIASESFTGGSADIAPESFTGRPVDNAPESSTGRPVDNAPESSTGRPVDNAPESFLDFPDASLPFETEYVPDITTASCSQQLDTGFADSLQSSAKDEIEQGSMVSDDRSEPFEDSSDDFVISDDELLYSSTTTSGCNSSGNCSKLTVLAGTSTAWSPPILSSTVNDECNFEPLPSVSTIQSVPTSAEASYQSPQRASSFKSSSPRGMSPPPSKVKKLSSDCDAASHSTGISSCTSTSVSSSLRCESLSVRSESPNRNLAGSPVSLGTGATIHLCYQSDVTLTSNVVLHKKKYTCSVIECPDGKSLIGFVDNEIPEASHVCEHPNNKEHTCVVVERKPKCTTIDLMVNNCIPKGTLSGNEIYVSSVSSYFSPLKFVEKKAQPFIKGKLHCCYYCYKMRAEISNHILRQHKTEPAVLEIAALAPNSKERNDRLKELRLHGDAHYNKQVPLETRIPVRKPTLTNIQNYITCLNCKGMIAPKNFARHERHCSNRISNYKQVTAEARKAAQEDRLADDPFTDRLLNDLLDPIKDDEIGHVVRSDFCLRQLSVKYAYLYRGHDSALINARQHLRRMARLLIDIRSLDTSVIDFEDLFVNGNYDSLIRGISILCDLDKNTGQFRKPALAQTIRSTVTTIIDELTNAYFKKGLRKDSEECRKVERFRYLHLNNYSAYVSRSARRTRLMKKMQNEQSLPDPSDIKIFSNYIVHRATEAHGRLLKHGFKYDTWLTLGKALLAQIIVFNRRRVGEVSKMRVSFFRERSSLDEVQKMSLTVLQRALADRFVRMKVLAKRDRIVHVLLDITQCRYLETFLSFRTQAGVSDENEYLFGVPSKIQYLDGSAVLRHFSVVCGAKNPNKIRATYLRKQFATMAQVLSMDDNQIHQVATYMGHTDEVHRRVYRQDEQFFQLTAMSKVLMMADQGDFAKYRGKTIEEIQLILQEEHVAEPGRQEENVSEDDIHLGDDGRNDNTNDFSTGSLGEPSSPRSLSALELPSTSSKSPVDTNLQSISISTDLPFASVPSTEPATTVRTKKSKVSKQRVVKPVMERKPGKVSYNKQEIALLELKFKEHLITKSLPKIRDCENVLNDNKQYFHPCRRSRDLYNWVQYYLKKKSKQ